MAASSPLCAEEGEKVRILLLNPNSTQMVTQRIQRAAAPYQSAELEITAATAKKAPPAIETAMDELQASIAVLEELEARKGTYDGAALCCFSDPGLECARRRSIFPPFTAGDFPSWAPVAPATCPICTAT